MSHRSQPHRFLSRQLVCAAIALVAIDPRAAAAASFNTAIFSVSITYASGEARYDGQQRRESTERLSRELELEHQDVLSSGGFVAGASGTLLQSAVEVGALVTIDDDVFWDTVDISGTSIAHTSDVLTIEGPAGAIGQIQFQWDAEGTLYHDLDRVTGTGGGYTIDAMGAQASLSFLVGGSGLSTPFEEAFAPPTDFLSPTTPNLRRDVSSGPDFTEYFLFSFNTPFRVEYFLVTDVSLFARNLDAGEFSWLGGAGFDNTANIRGLAVYDEAGVPIANPMIHSESGISYAIVPEASTLLLFAFGTAGLAVGARRGPNAAQRPPARSAAASSARECTPSFSKIP